MTNEVVPHAWPTEVSCLIYVEDMFLINHYNIEIGFDTSTANPVLHDIAFEKVRMFFEVLMNNSIIITHQDFKEKKIKFENNYIELPGMLNDQTLGSAIYAKLVVLVGEDLVIEYVKISSALGKGVRYTINDDGPEVHTLLPGKAEWWDNEDVKFYPWWLRQDPATYDELIEGDKIYEGEFSWNEHFEEDLKEAETLDPKAKKFKIITGGKDEVKPTK
jgi:hypothetical protein